MLLNNRRNLDLSTHAYKSPWDHIDPQLQQIGINVRRFLNKIVLVSKIQFVYFISFFIGAKPIQAQDESSEAYKARLTSWFEQFLQLGLDQEVQLFPDRNSDLLRRLLTSDPLFASLAAGIGSNNVDVMYNDRFPPVSTRNINRQRTFEAIPVAFLLFPVLSYLAGDETLRTSINKLIVAGVPIPAFFQEKLNSNRSADTLNFIVGFRSEDIFTPDDLRLLNLEKTIFDLKWLSTDAGLDALMQFFYRLNSYEGNYIKVVQGKPVLATAGQTLTETALSTETDFVLDSATTTVQTKATSASTSTVLSKPTTVQVPVERPVAMFDKLVRVLPGHAYGNLINQVQAVDSYLMNRRLFTGEVQFIIGVFSDQAEILSSSSNFALYAILRVTGEIHNSKTLALHTPAKTTPGKDNAQDAPPADNKKGDNQQPPEAVGDKANSSRGRRAKFNGEVNFIVVLDKLLRDNFISARQFERIMRCIKIVTTHGSDQRKLAF